MKVAIRTDASFAIGTGHVMRCLTLANGLRTAGAEVAFLTRAHDGNLDELIRTSGFEVLSLGQSSARDVDEAVSPYARWLGAGQLEDAEATSDWLSPMPPDILLVDHYGLDHVWEEGVSGLAAKLVVIDDLCSRRHRCDVLIDQNLGRTATDYADFVSADCLVLAGTEFAMLRDEFRSFRHLSLGRRSRPQVEQILISMGGVDLENATGAVLEALRTCRFPAECRLVIIMGPSAPWLDSVKKVAQTLPWPTEVRVGVSNMAEVMSDSDIAFGAAGSTSWERCCLGLPSLFIVLAENQQAIAEALAQQGAAVHLCSVNAPDFIDDLRNRTNELLDDRAKLATLSEVSSRLVDGLGVERVVNSVLGEK